MDKRIADRRDVGDRTDRYFWPLVAALTVCLILGVSLIVGMVIA